jgi:hypothetical protein
MKALIISTTLLLLAIQGHAEILIYKGLARSVSDVSTGLPRGLTFFEVIDPNAGTIASVSAISVDGQKAANVSPPRAYGIASAPLSDGRTATIISLIFANGGTGGSFNNIALHRRGTNTNLKINSEPIANAFVFPRRFASIAFADSAINGDASFIEQRAVLVYQQDRTIAANDANQTTQQAIDAIVAELKAKGFQIL